MLIKTKKCLENNNSKKIRRKLITEPKKKFENKTIDRHMFNFDFIFSSSFSYSLQFFDTSLFLNKGKKTFLALFLIFFTIF